MTINPTQPIYLGVSQGYFTRMQELNILDGDAKLTLSMAIAEKNAKEFDDHSRNRARKGFAGLGRILTSLFSSPPPPPSPIVTARKVRGVVVKFNTAKLMQNYQLFVFDQEVRISTEVLQSVMLYVDGFYEVIDIEELEQGNLYA